MTEQVRATGAVVEFISRARWPEFPADAVALAKRCVIDGLGVMLAGSATSAASAILRDYTRGSDRSTDATAFAPEPFRTGAASAALLNGTSGHALDWDDTQLSTSAGSHLRSADASDDPPARGGAGARRTAARLGRAVSRGVSHRLRGGVQDRGGDPSASLQERLPLVRHGRDVRRDGGVGQAARPGSRRPRRHALAIAASMASGIRVNFGTMTKPLHVGRAAQNGVIAAELAAKGFTGGHDALDPPWGFFQVFSFGDGFDADRIVGRLGNPYTIVSPGVSIKPYPVRRARAIRRWTRCGGW